GSSSTSAHVATATPGGGTASGGMSTASAGGSTPALGPAPAPPSNFPVGRPTRPVTGLRPDQSYEVTVALTRSDGGIDTINSLERLGILPNPQNRLLVELGVL